MNCSEPQLWHRQPLSVTFPYDLRQSYTFPSAMAVTLSMHSLKQDDVLFNVCVGVSLSDGFVCFSACQCVHADASKKTGRNFLALFYCICFERLYLCVCLYVCKRVCVHTQVQSSSSVLILRVLTVSIESSWQLKEEHKIGKWGGVSMLRPLPPHSSLAEDVWIYSGNATFERNKWEGSSFLLCVWIPSSGVSLCSAVQHRS